MIKASELMEKEVVNVTDGKKIGMIIDFEVDLNKGKINAVIVPDGDRIMGLFSKETEHEIRWNHIKKIGEDIILIEIKDNNESFTSTDSIKEVTYIPKDSNVNKENI